jgi:hypothetical protein
MITIKRFDNAVEAYLLKSRLQNEGIPAFIVDENIVTLMPLYSNLVGGVKLCVSELDVEIATKVLCEIDRAGFTDESGNRISCPRCNSTSFYHGFKTIGSVKGIVAYMVFLFFGVYPLHYDSVKRCKECEYEF